MKTYPVHNLTPRLKTYGVVEVQLHALLTSAQGRGEWSASRSGRFTPRKTLGTHLIGD